jgi:hypothetical protein
MLALAGRTIPAEARMRFPSRARKVRIAKNGRD